MPYYKTKPSKSFKWMVLHIDDDAETQARYFQSKGDAIRDIEDRSGFRLSEVKQ